MSQEIDEKTVKIATMVIIHAGNARSLVNEAIQAAAKDDTQMAREKLEQAKQEIHSAHATQTEVIQEEARGEALQITLLLTHAQDTLMTAMSEMHMAKYILALYERLQSLEAQIDKN